MRAARTGTLVALLCALSVSASAYVVEVFDPVNFIQHQLQNRWRETIGIVIENQLDKIQRMAQRLSAFTNLAKYVAPDAPLWRTRRIEGALAASDAFMAALNGGDARGAGYEAVARASVAQGRRSQDGARRTSRPRTRCARAATPTLPPAPLLLERIRQAASAEIDAAS